MVYYTVSGYNGVMFMVGLLSWWYGTGWLQRAQAVRSRLVQTADSFSIGMLLMTLFAPFRQISAGSVGGSLSDRFRGFIDRTISRFVGAFMRTFVIIAGLVVLSLQAVFYVILLIFWPLVPLFPAIGIIMMIIGWTPQWI